MAAGKFVDISLIGDKELERAFRELPLAVEKRIVRKAQVRSMRVIRRSVLSRVPVLTGNLKRAIKARAFKTRTGVIGRLLLLPRRAALGIGPDEKHYYPAAVEYGHRGVPAIPFLRGGFDAAEAEAFRVLKSEIESGIIAEGQRLAR